MLRRLANPVASLVGIGFGIAMIVGAMAGVPHPHQAAASMVLFPTNSTIAVAADNDNGTSPTGLCGLPGCVVFGVSTFFFNVSTPSAITGTLTSSGPLQIVLASGGEIRTVQCDYEARLCLNGSQEVDPGLVFFDPSISANGTSFDLGSLTLNFQGSNDVLPEDNWAIYFLNGTPTAETVTVSQAVTLTPT